MDYNKKLHNLYNKKDYKKTLELLDKMIKKDIEIDRYCHICNVKMKEDLIDMVGKLSGNNLTIEGIKCYKCPDCGGVIFDSESCGKIQEWLEVPEFAFVGFKDPFC